MQASKLGTTLRTLRKFWHFFWHDDSLASFLLNIIVAFVIIKYLIYPGLGLVLGTPFPIVAVVSESMEHGLHRNLICGQQFENFPESFQSYWNTCGKWYEPRGISKKQFSTFPFQNGFNKGDVIILWRAHPGNLRVGDVLVFQGDKPQPIIHRIVKIWKEGDKTFYQTKGDHNRDSVNNGRFDESKISQERVYGKGVLRLPYLGWLKIIFVEVAQMFGVSIIR